MLQTSVDSVVVRDAPTVTPETSVTDAATRLRDPAVPGLVVLDGPAVVGVVTESDLVAMVAETADRSAVSSIMTSPVTTTTPAATVTDAARTMQAAGVRLLPVVGDDEYVGLVSDRTLAPYVSRRHLDIDWRAEPKRFATASVDRDGLLASD